MASDQAVSAAAPDLKRVLTLLALIICGIILIQPTTPMPLVGVACDKAQGRVVTLILLGIVAMLLGLRACSRALRAKMERMKNY